MRKNALLYGLFCLLILAAQSLWYVAYHGREAMLVAFDLAVLVFLTVVVNIRTALDMRGGELPLGELLAWAFGRLWAVIIIDFVVWLTLSAGTAMAFTPASADTFLGGAFFLVAAAGLIFCDVVASVEPHAHWYAIVPAAIRRSIRLAFAHGNILRALAIVIFQAVFTLLEALLQQFLSDRGIKGAEFWGNQPLNTLLTPFFAALTTVVYFDALAREREAED